MPYEQELIELSYFPGGATVKCLYNNGIESFCREFVFNGEIKAVGEILEDADTAKEATVTAGFAAAATAAALAIAQGNITTILSRVTAAVAKAPDLATAQAAINEIHAAEFGRLVIDPALKTLTHYAADNVTIIKVFDLTTSLTGLPPVIERVPR